jgi:hypothetical protein
VRRVADDYPWPPPGWSARDGHEDRPWASAATPRPTRDESSPPLRVGDTAHWDSGRAIGPGSLGPRQGWRCRHSGVALSSAGPSLVGNVCSPTRSRRQRLDHLTLIEDIAMTSAVLILALSGLGGLHGAHASGQCPTAPSKCMPACQAPCKTMPSCQAPCKTTPSCQAPCKTMPSCQAPSKCAPACGAPSKCLPACSAPSKCAPSCQAPGKATPQG